MVAVLKIIKYSGNNCIFGNEVISIGLKRQDITVPNVYNAIDIVPSDDASDSLKYAILTSPEGGPVNSFESIFKIHLKVKPDNQLTNIRIFPNIAPPSSPTAAKMFIGISQSYTRPTNNVSTVAIHNIYEFTEENPFLITIGGVSGYQISPTIFGVDQYQVTTGDTGSGNKLFLNGNKQEAIKIIENNSDPYLFVNHVTTTYTLSIFDAATSLPIPAAPIPGFHPDIDYGSTMGEQTIIITPTTALKTAYPMGFKYGTTAILPTPTTGINMGATISWFTLAQVPTETLTFTVESLPDPTVGHNVFYIDNVKKPMLDFQAGKIYVFNNITGAIDPFRFVTRGLGGDETNVIITGITVLNGGTNLEVVTVDTTLVNMSGKYPRSYVSTFPGHSDYGNQVKFFCSNNNGGHSSGHSQDEGQAHAIGRHTGFFVGEGHSHGPHSHGNSHGGHSGDSHGHSNDWNNPHGFHTFPIDNTGFYNMNTVGGGTSDPLNSGECDYIYLQLRVSPDTDPGDVLPELIIRYDES